MTFSTRYLLTNLNTQLPADIIAISDPLDYNGIINTLDLRGIGFVHLTEDDATKLVFEYGGIGIGCYVNDNVTATERQYRILEAGLRYTALSDIVGMIRVCNPKALSYGSVLAKREELAAA